MQITHQNQSDPKPELGNWLRNIDRSVAVVAAILLVLALGTTAVTLDAAAVYRTQEDFHRTLDKATIAVAEKEAKTSIVDKSLAMSFLDANSKSWALETLDASLNEDGKLTLTAAIKIPTFFMKAVGTNEYNYTLSRSAVAVTQDKLSRITLDAVRAKGKYSKDIYFFTRDENGEILEEKPVLSYRYGSEPSLTPVEGSSITFDVADYKTYGYSMVVYEDPDLKGALVNPRKHYSDDANGAKWTRVSGTCDDANGIAHEWDESGNLEFDAFQFSQKCVAFDGKVINAKLVR